MLFRVGSYVQCRREGDHYVKKCMTAHSRLFLYIMQFTQTEQLGPIGKRFQTYFMGHLYVQFTMSQRGLDFNIAYLS